MSIPGSHDTACVACSLIAKGVAETTAPADVAFALSLTVCQNACVSDQFDAGARMFDLRPYFEQEDAHEQVAGKIRVAHCPNGSTAAWFMAQSAFAELLESLGRKLEQNPSEFVIVRVAIERDVPADQAPAYVAELNSTIEYWDGQGRLANHVNADTRLEDLRGKMILIPENICGKGVLPASVANPIEDLNVPVAEFFESFPGDDVDNHDPQAIIDNWRKADAGAFCFSQTNKPSTKDLNPEVQAAGMHQALNHFLDHSPVHTGVTLIDFVNPGPGPDGALGNELVRRIVAANFN
jgi:hypothetical protein